jgi:hypothetical protein
MRTIKLEHFPFSTRLVRRPASWETGPPGLAAAVSQSLGQDPGGAKGGGGTADESRRGTAASWPPG